jgi:hypothetical protein
MDSQGALYVVQQEVAHYAVKNAIYGLTKWTGTPGSMTKVWQTQFADGPPYRTSYTSGKDTVKYNLDSIARASNFAGIGLNEKNGIVYVTRRNTNGRPLHNVIGYSMATGQSISLYSFATGHSIGNAGDTTNVTGGGGNNIRDLTVDAAGNVVWVNSSSEHLGVHSPPAGPNSFLTHSGWAIKAGTGVIVTPADPLLSVNADYVRVPGEFSLSQNYPNPFNPETIIKFSLPRSSDVKLVVIDMLGREVKQLVNSIHPAGTHQIAWDGRDNGGNRVASGAYFYRLTASDVGSGRVSHFYVKRMLLLK